MKRFIIGIIALFTVLSCGKNGTDGIYISVRNSCWQIAIENQVAWPCFIGNDIASIVQVNYELGAYQIMNGSYTVDGHRVRVAAESSVLMVRTMSNLKNSSNKNFTRLAPEAPSSLEGTLWVSMRDYEFNFVYHGEGGEYLSGVFYNFARREGLPYGWDWEVGTYAVNGSQYVLEEENGTFYGDKFMVLDNLAIPRVHKARSLTGTSSLKGTVWTLQQGSGYPGFILFTSATEFVRVLVNSNIVFVVLEGTYNLEGNSLELETSAEELCRTCTIENGKFTYLQRTYALSDLTDSVVVP